MEPPCNPPLVTEPGRPTRNLTAFAKAGNLLLVGQTPYSALQKRLKMTRKKAATISVTALFHYGTGSET